jgi:hypothetical protein
MRRAISSSEKEVDREIIPCAVVANLIEQYRRP